MKIKVVWCLIGIAVAQTACGRGAWIEVTPKGWRRPGEGVRPAVDHGARHPYYLYPSNIAATRIDGKFHFSVRVIERPESPLRFTVHLCELDPDPPWRFVEHLGNPMSDMDPTKSVKSVEYRWHAVSHTNLQSEAHGGGLLYTFAASPAEAARLTFAYEITNPERLGSYTQFYFHLRSFTEAGEAPNQRIERASGKAAENGGSTGAVHP
jgi:hypothetical protein